MKKITVYTFCEHRPGRKPRFSAYTMWANPSWPGCRAYEVEAKNGTEAKKLAIELRRLDEVAYQEHQADIRVT